jgi:hypothetical protein
MAEIFCRDCSIWMGVKVKMRRTRGFCAWHDLETFSDNHCEGKQS